VKSLRLFIFESLGDCFKAAWKHQRANPHHALVHADVVGDDGRTFPHAWTEHGEHVHDVSNGQHHVVPKAAYYERAQAKNVRRYDSKTALKTGLQSKHFGPWG
jgi:hypothetical protein